MENNEFPENMHLIGDSAYPLKTNLMVPFKDNGHLTEVQINFNKVLSKTRGTIENSFTLLKGRFRQLKLMELSRPDLIPLMIMSTCILHNICLKVDDIPPDINIEAKIECMTNPGINIINENNNPVNGK